MLVTLKHGNSFSDKRLPPLPPATCVPLCVYALALSGLSVKLLPASLPAGIKFNLLFGNDSAALPSSNWHSLEVWVNYHQGRCPSVLEITLLANKLGKVCFRVDTDGPCTKTQNHSQSSSCSSREATPTQDITGNFPEHIIYCIDRVKYWA